MATFTKEVKDLDSANLLLRGEEYFHVLQDNYAKKVNLRSYIPQPVLNSLDEARPVEFEHIKTIRILGYYEPGDGGHGVYRKVDIEPPHEGKFQSQDGSWWELIPENGMVNHLQFGNNGLDAASDY